jgi:glucosamine 6-phosphate synthetase-like amidotransferase/phosphosugar isomerase protein
MCGVFGFIANGKGGRFDVDRMEAIAVNTQTRGRHAHGLAWIDSRNRLRAYKAAGAIDNNLGALDMAGDARMLIGHCRWATNGSPQENINNHPHPCDGGWLVHNGVVFNAADLACEYELQPTSACDSEIIAQLIETLEGTLLARAIGATDQLEGPAVVMGLWARPARMLVVRRGKPLHVEYDRAGNVYFASLPCALNDPDRVRDNTARLFSFSGGTLYQTILEIEPCRKRPAEKNPPLGRPLRHYCPPASCDSRRPATR